MAREEVKRWAVLIGIDCYLQDRPLKGCVRDVNALKQHIQAGSPPDDLDISFLTATGTSATEPLRPREEPKQLPTHENVIGSLTRILLLSSPGDMVYIHYSGHGTRNSITGHLALVLFDHEHGTRLLHGELLSSVLERMTDKGLFVTLVLDCCFSGVILRADDHSYTGIRETSYDPAIGAPYPSTGADLSLASESGPFRDGFVLPHWLASPTYTIFTACSPTEIAEEIEVEIRNSNGKERRGALSYFLLQALISLRKKGVEISTSSLYQHLLTTFHAYWPRQTPMRRGNKNLSFFGSLEFESNLEFIPVFVTDDNRLFLDAGHAHDVQDRDEYVLYPFDTSEAASSQANQPGQKFRVTSVGCLTAELIAIQPTARDHRIETGWKARLLTRFPTQPIPVRVITNPKSRAEWIRATEHHPSLHLHLDGDREHCLFNVRYNVRDEYEVLDASYANIVSVAPASAKEPGTIQYILDVLQHLANFKRFEGLANRVPDPSFERSFEILVNEEVGLMGAHQVKHGNEIQFDIKNASDKPLYVTLFDLRQSGQILNLMLESGVEFIVVEPEDTYPLCIKMEVPETLKPGADKTCEDVFKFFVARKGLYFPSEVLPEIAQPPIASYGSTRDGNHRDHLVSFLHSLEAQFRGSEDTAWHSHWTTRNFVVRTVKD